MYTSFRQIYLHQTIQKSQKSNIFIFNSEHKLHGHCSRKLDNAMYETSYTYFSCSFQFGNRRYEKSRGSSLKPAEGETPLFIV